MTDPVDPEFASVLRKAFDVLASFGPTRHDLSLSDISRRSGLPKTTTHRVLRQMVSVGAVERDGHRYHIGTKMFALSSPSREVTLRNIALPHITELSRRCGHTTHLAVLCGSDVLYLEKLQSYATVPIPTAVGARVQAHCTALGKALLACQAEAIVEELCRPGLARRTAASISSPDRLWAALENIRLNGFAADNEEAVPGLRCLAVPILAGGQAVAAVSIAHPSSAAQPKYVLRALQESAARISRAAKGCVGLLSAPA